MQVILGVVLDRGLRRRDLKVEDAMSFLVGFCQFRAWQAYADSILVHHVSRTRTGMMNRVCLRE